MIKLMFMKDACPTVMSLVWWLFTLLAVLLGWDASLIALGIIMARLECITHSAQRKHERTLSKQKTKDRRF